MGARPSSFKKGGGQLDGVDAVIRDYEFTDTWPGKDEPSTFKDQKTGEEVTSLLAVVTVQVEGATETSYRVLKAGNLDRFSIEEDGKLLMPVNEGDNISAQSEFGKFLTSLVHPEVGDGFPEDSLDEDDIRYEPIIGARVRLVEAPKTDKTGKVLQRTAKKGKFKGRTFDQTVLQVSQYYGQEEEEKPAKRLTNGSGKPVNTAKPLGTKTSSKAPKDPDIDALAAETLLGILGAQKSKSIPKAKLSVAVLQYTVKDANLKPYKEEIRKRIFDDEFLGQDDQGWAYDPADKNQTVSIEA